jgi:biotin carboxylase
MHVLILEPLSSGTALVQAARRMGLGAIVFTANQGERQLSAECKEWATSATTVDTYDGEAVFRAAEQLHRDVNLQAVIPGFEYCVDVAAKTAARLGLPHLPEVAATAARNKFVCRERLKAAGLNVPRYALMHTPTDIEVSAKAVGFPAVLKPTDGGGSLFVQRVDSILELRRAFESFSPGLFDVGHFVGAPFLLEEFLEGPEFSIEGYIDRGQPHVLAVTEKHLGEAPCFVEMGHVVEAAISVDERREMVKYVEQVTRAIDLRLGAFHAEARITTRGPVLIEINCRLGGDRIVRLVELAKGISLPAAMVRSYCGLEILQENISLGQRHGVAGVRFLSMAGSAVMGNVMGNVKGMEEVRAMPGCEEVEMYFRAGEKVPALTDFRGRVGHVLFTADNRSALDERLRQAEKRIQILPQQA